METYMLAYIIQLLSIINYLSIYRNSHLSTQLIEIYIAGMNHKSYRRIDLEKYLCKCIFKNIC